MPPQSKALLWVKYLPKNIGLYIHIPFCEKKCFYCNFYSACISEKVYKDYILALFREIRAWGKKVNRTVDTIYIGGGTPSLLGRDILPLMNVVRESFCVSVNAEVTAECNPSSNTEFLAAAAKSGVNRLSFGVQSGNDSRLKALGRTHTAKDTVFAVNTARKAGIDNISCDIMIALPDSSLKTLKEDIDFILDLYPDHISAYILKIEEKTVFGSGKSFLNLPDDDNTADQYLYLCSELEKRGYEHYEISNFARGGKKSRHNLKYWRCEEYLGIGPSAHSCISGERFYYPSDIRGFIAGALTEAEGTGGSTEEKIMLGLRLNTGVELSYFSDASLRTAEKLEKSGLLKNQDGKIVLTDRGMLLSNSIITELTYENV